MFNHTVEFVSDKLALTAALERLAAAPVIALDIAGEAERGSIHALRDYSVTLFYLFSGLRRNELFDLRGNDIELREDGLIVRYKRKGGKYQRREVAHGDVREALLAYLKKSRRLSVLHMNDPLWTRHDRAGEPGLPLTSRSYANNLKKYAAKAGMRRVNIHQTRHTYARIIFEDSGDLLKTQSALDHESHATTRVYIHIVAVKRDKHSNRIARRVGSRMAHVSGSATGTLWQTAGQCRHARSFSPGDDIQAIA
jgi:integrase